MGAGRVNGLHKRRKPTRLVDGLIKGFFDLFHASIVDRKSINESVAIYRMENMSIHAISRSHRLRLGMTEQQLADRVGVTRAAVQQWEREGGTAPRRTKQADVAAALGISLSELLGAETGAMLPTPAHEPSNVANTEPSSLVPAPTPAPGDAIVRVPVLANAGSMGAGNDLLHDDVLVGQIDLSEQWLLRRIKPTSPQALRFIHAYGDSMSPTFEDGDVLLVDTGMRDPRLIDGVYVMAANDRMYVKRVRQRLDGTIEISSDNSTVKTVDVLNGGNAIDVLGRVVWCWNGRKL